MGSFDLHQSLSELEKSIKSSGSSQKFSVNWSENLKLVIDEFSHPEEEEGEIPVRKCQDKSTSTQSREAELLLLKAAYALSNANRRISLSKLLNLQGNIRVFCRIRPYLPCEARPESSPLQVIGGDEIKVVGEHSKTFKFDKVFTSGATQEDVFLDVQNVIRCALDGQNVCVCAYGQTGTGKTYTMEGTKSSPGIIPRALELLFRDTSADAGGRYRFTLSMLEIYKGSLRDLLVSRPTKLMDPPAKSLNIHLSVSEYVEVENLTEYVIENAADALKFYRKGIRSRSTSTTISNESSSRSHCLVRLNILRQARQSSGKPPVTTVSKLWLIDLAGSERFFKTQAWGKPLEEGKAINVSLTALGDVISALQKKQPHIPYRNSKLTQILRDCLVNNSRVLMFVHPSPKEEDYAETVCSLTFASRVRGIHIGRESPSNSNAARLLLSKMQALEGECYRLSCDIQSLESIIPRKSSGERVNCSSQAEDRALNTNCSKVKSASTASLPRFMTPTLSSLSKHREVGEFAPVWPSSSLEKMKQQPKGVLVPLQSDEKQKSKAAAGNTKSSSVCHVDVSTPRKDGCSDHQSPKSVPSSSHHRHRSSSFSFSSSKDEMKQRPPPQQHRNVSRIQRRLTLECSGKLSIA